MFFYLSKVCFIAKSDNANSRYLVKADNSTFHVFELNTGLIFVISSGAFFIKQVYQISQVYLC